MTGVRRAALAVVALLSLLLVSVVPPARAEEDVPIGNGRAAASAIVTRITPGVGSLPTGLFGGVALSDVTNRVARAQAETLDLGLIGALLRALAIVPGDVFPEPLAVDNREGPATAEADEVPILGSTLAAGRKAVGADEVPSSRSSSSLVGSFGDVVALDAGRAEASTRVLPGAGREARASVSVDLDLGGVVQLRGLRWQAHHRSGATEASDGSFTIDAGTVGGIPIPTEVLGPVEEVANAALAPLGLTLQLPTVVRSADPVPLVRVTPLRVVLADTPAGKAALGPLLGLTRDQRQQLFDELTDVDGSLGAPLLAADVLLSILSGTGFLAIEVGGAEASSGPTPSAAPAPVPADSAVAGGPLPGLAADPGVVTGPTGSGSTSPGGRTGLTTSCRSAHERRMPACSDGSVALAGFAGLAAVAAAVAADHRHQRRRRARLAAEGVAVAVSTARSLRAYLPLAGAAVALVVVAVTVGVPREEVAYRGDLTIPATELPAVGADGRPVAGPLDPTPGQVLPAASSGVQPCRDRRLQVPGDPYSPPCYSFRGDNGGATATGVTADRITVAVRNVPDGSATDIFASLTSQGIDASDASFDDTLAALGEYFSSRFQLYGRSLDLRRYRGTGNGINELLGGGKESALADAVTVAKEMGAFADVSAVTLPYADALSRHGVVNFGAPYPSRTWFEERRPYAWSLFPDGTNVVSATTSAVVGRYPPGSAAEHAGEGLRGRPRRFGIVAPENAEYQQSIQVLIDQLRAANIDVGTNQRYKLDLVSFPNQASNVIAQLKDRGVTSVICMCDPAMLAFGLTPKANEQGYEPEWITAGLVFVDQDVVAQIIDQRQWAHAFGTAYNAESERIGASAAYRAYKSVRPDGEPIAGIEELYYQLYQLVIGLQMAGPNLTPETLQAGLFAYPGAFGPRGTWDFGPGDYTPTNDYREIWWDPTRPSRQNDRPGAWVELDGGRRWSPLHPPHGRAPFFEEG